MRTIMNCVYEAWKQHIRHLDSDLSDDEFLFAFDLYYAIRCGCGNRHGFTWGGIVPAIIRAVSGVYGYSVRIEYRIWTPEHFIADIQNGKSGLDEELGQIALWMVEDRLFWKEVDQITLEPAIYLLLGRRHAVFDVKVPRKGHPIMALQVYKPCEG